MGYNDDFTTRAQSQCILCTNNETAKGWVAGDVVTFPDGDLYTQEASGWAPTVSITDDTVHIPDGGEAGTGTGTGS